MTKNYPVYLCALSGEDLGLAPGVESCIEI